MESLDDPLYMNSAVSMGVRRNFSRGEKSRHFAYPFQFVGDATQMDVHKKCPMLRQQFHTVFSQQENFTLRKFCFSENGYFKTELAEF